MRSKRFQELEGRPVNKETFIRPMPEAGLLPADSPNDPAPGLKIKNGRVMEMDGIVREDFDMIDYFIEHCEDGRCRRGEDFVPMKTRTETIARKARAERRQSKAEKPKSRR